MTPRGEPQPSVIRVGQLHIRAEALGYHQAVGCCKRDRGTAGSSMVACVYVRTPQHPCAVRVVSICNRLLLLHAAYLSNMG